MVEVEKFVRLNPLSSYDSSYRTNGEENGDLVAHCVD